MMKMCPALTLILFGVSVIHQSELSLHVTPAEQAEKNPHIYSILLCEVNVCRSATQQLYGSKQYSRRDVCLHNSTKWNVSIWFQCAMDCKFSCSVSERQLHNEPCLSLQVYLRAMQGEILGFKESEPSRFSHKHCWLQSVGT